MDYYDLDLDDIDATLEGVMVCDRCGAEAGTKLIGDEMYYWCNEDGCVEDAVHMEYDDER